MEQASRKSGRRELILTAARSRFRTTGLAATTLDMIAADVGIARPNLYRYFRDKTELLSDILNIEAKAINAERWANTKRLRTFANRVITSLELAARLVHDDPFWSALNSPDNVPYTALVASEDPGILATNEQYWLPILEQAHRSGELRPNLDFVEVMRWMLGLEFMFIERRELFPDSKNVRRYAEVFVIPALATR